MINKFRRLLIRLGKILPFVMCAFVFACYCESLFALSFNKYVMYQDSLVLNTPISFAIASKVQYDIFTLFIILVISISVETCRWNKLALLYLFVQLGEKSYFTKVELYAEYIYFIITLNLLICAFFVYKGITIITKH